MADTHDQTADTLTQTHKLATLRKIINDATAAWLVSHGSCGKLHGRPMATAQVEDDIETIWFATQRDSGKVEEIQADPRVYLAFTNGSGSEWASLNGRATIVEDAEKRRELWTPLWRNWFESPDDPNIVLIAVTPTEAEYWDAGSRVVLLAKMAVAAVTGVKLPDPENAHVTIGHPEAIATVEDVT